jgi:bifunctional non-homologous end joining protein LigD
VYGEKLRGRFVLIRTDLDASGREQWLLLHKRDEHAVDGWDPEDHPRSVVSGLTNDELSGP